MRYLPSTAQIETQGPVSPGTSKNYIVSWQEPIPKSSANWYTEPICSLKVGKMNYVSVVGSFHGFGIELRF